MAAVAAEADAARAASAARYFKTGVGQYGEGDVFAGVSMPQVRRIAARFRELDASALADLLASEVHEHRSVALVTLVSQYRRAPEETTERYLAAVRAGRVNNWDLVDVSAEFILGEYLFDRPRDLLFELARSESLWERRVAILSTFGFIKHGDASTTLQIAALLLDDREDLMHKAVGWMLREVGKRVDQAHLIAFLDAHAAQMPRTALSYAVEHLSPEQRAHYRSR